MTIIKALVRTLFRSPQKGKVLRRDLVFALSIVVLIFLVCILPAQQPHQTSQTPISSSSASVQAHTQPVGLGGATDTTPTPQAQDPCASSDGIGIQQCAPNQQYCTSSCMSPQQQSSNMQNCLMGQQEANQNGMTKPVCQPDGNLCNTVSSITNECVLGIQPNINQNNNITTPLGKDNILFFFTSPAMTVNHGTVQQLWQQMLIIVDIFIVVLILLNGATVILGGTVFRYAKVLEALPGIFLALIAAHCSMFIMSLFLGFSNTLSVDLYNWSALPANKGLVSAGPSVQDQFTIPTLYNSTRSQSDIDGTPLYDGDPTKGATAGPHSSQGAPTYMVTNGFLIDITSNDQPTPTPTEVDKCVPGDIVKGYVNGVGKVDLQMDSSYTSDHFDGSPDVIQIQYWTCDIYGTDHDVLRDVSGTAASVGNANAATTLDFTNLIRVDPTDPASTLSNIRNLANIFPLAAKILGLMLLAQFILRLFFLDFYIVLSPLGLASWALPGKAGQPLTRLWLKGFFSTLLVQVLQVVAIIITQTLIGDILGYTTINLFSSNGQPLMDIHTLASVIQVIVLWFIFRIPSLIGTAPAHAMVEIGQTVQQTVSTSIAMQLTNAQLTISAYYAQEGMSIARQGMQQNEALGGAGLVASVV